MKSRNNNLGIFGLSLTGKAGYEFCKNMDYNIICYDDNIANVENFTQSYGNQDIKDLSAPDWQKLDQIMVSPGVPPTHKIFKIANEYNIRIISDIELLYQYNQDADYIGITGTNGKSTTTALTAHILQEVGMNYPAAGNIGVPVLSLANLAKHSGYILELSSFQIDLFNELTPQFQIAALLNITPDHLDRYITIDNYINSKLKILSHIKPQGFAIINFDNNITRSIIDNNPGFNIIPFSVKEKLEGGVSIIDNQIFDDIFKPLISDISANRALQGSHNMENIAASYAICRLLKVPVNKILEAITTFSGLEHRMQYIGRMGNVSFYNDSKATNTDSASKSIAALDNIYWLAGGILKETNLDSIAPYFYKISMAYLYGRDREVLARYLEGKVNYTIYSSLQEAFAAAYDDARLIQKASNILLAPACASLDQFKNFQERGNAFINLFQALK